MMATKIKAKRGSGNNIPGPPISKSLTNVVTTLEEIIVSKQSPVDIKKFAYLFMDKIGGAEGFTEKVLEEYNGSPVGSLARSRVLEIMMKLFSMATPKETFGDYGDFTDDDLKEMLKKQLGTMAPIVSLKWVDHVCI